MTAVMGVLGDADAGDGLGDAVLQDKEVFGLEARDELVGLVEDDVSVNVDDGDVDAERVSLVVGVLDLGCRRGGGGWRLVGLLLFLEDDAAVVGCGDRHRRGGGGVGLVVCC